MSVVACRQSLHLIAVAGAILAVSNIAFAQPHLVQRSASLPKFDDFPNRRMPTTTGVFSWCGAQDRYLIWHFGAPSLLLDAASDAEGVQVPSLLAPSRCDETGANIISPNSSRDALVRFNVEQRTKETVALYRELDARTFPQTISTSPSLKSVAYDARMIRFNEENTKVKLLPLVAGEDQHTGMIDWKADSSKLFQITWSQAVARSHKTFISIVDVATGKTVRGDLPADYNFMSGRFLDSGRELLVFMRPRGDLPPAYPPGTVFRCSISPFTCRPVVSDVDEVSMNEHGLIGAVTLIYRDQRARNESDSFVFPDKYVFRALDVDGRTLIRQEMRGRGISDVNIHIAPSSRRIVLRWSDIKQWCGTNCEVGKIVELPKLN